MRIRECRGACQESEHRVVAARRRGFTRGLRPAGGMVQGVPRHGGDQVGAAVDDDTIDQAGIDRFPQALAQGDRAKWEELFQAHQIDGGDGQADVALPPDDFNRLASAVSERIAAVAQNGRFPAIVTTTRRRKFLQTVLKAKGIRNPVISFEEIAPGTKPALLGSA